MSDAYQPPMDSPELEEMENYPHKPSKKEKKRAKKEKKKGGILGKILCLFFGFLFGIIFVFGAVAFAVYTVATSPIDETVEAVDKATGGDLYSTLFGTVDANGELVEAGILNPNYAEKKVGDLIGDISDAFSSFSSDSPSLAPLNEVSPKIGEAIDSFADTFRDYGIQLDTQELLNASLKGDGDNSLVGCFKNAILDAPAGDFFTAFSGNSELSPIISAICYGEEGVDYIVEADGTITMIGDAAKTTIRQLIGDEDLDELLNKISIASILDVSADEDAIVMVLLYGRENVHYQKDGAEITMLPKYVYKTSTGEVYDAWEEKMTNVTIDGSTYVDEKGKEYTYQTSGETITINGDTCEKVYLYNGSEQALFSPTTLGDLTGDNSVISMLVNRVTVGEVFDESTINGNRFLPFVQNETINSLPNAIMNLKVSEVYADEIYKNGVDGELNPEWSYLLTNNGVVDENITVNNMNQMIDNMQNNVHTATLYELRDNGLVQFSGTFLDSEIKTSVGPYAINFDTNGKTKMGEMTVSEMLEYVDALFTIINLL